MPFDVGIRETRLTDHLIPGLQTQLKHTKKYHSN